MIPFVLTTLAVISAIRPVSQSVKLLEQAYTSSNRPRHTLPRLESLIRIAMKIETERNMVSANRFPAWRTYEDMENGGCVERTRLEYIAAEELSDEEIVALSPRLRELVCSRLCIEIEDGEVVDAETEECGDCLGNGFLSGTCVGGEEDECHEGSEICMECEGLGHLRIEPRPGIVSVHRLPVAVDGQKQRLAS